MRPRFWRRLAAPACALAIVIGSFSYYTIYRDYWLAGRSWQAGQFDPADYRLMAEHFWKIKSEPSTYHFDRTYERVWADYLGVVPFRGIGVGTAFEMASWVINGRPAHTPSEVAAAGQTLTNVEKALTALALLLLFAVARAICGAVPALIALSVVALPPSLWRLTEELMSEPALRIDFILLMAAAIALRHPRWRIPAAVSIAVLWLVATHLKVQWWVGAALVVPILIQEFAADGFGQTAAAVAAIGVAIPLGLLAVNWIGWHHTSLSPGIGIHAHIEYGDDLLKGFCDQYQAPAHPPPFCDPARPRIKWWNLYMGGDVPTEAYDALDRYARRYVLAHPVKALTQFVDGLTRAASFPGHEVTRGQRLRIEPLPQVLRPVAELIDLGVWAALLLGLYFRKTRLMALTALVLWIVPALGDVFSWYEPRYHQPMGGIGLAAAVLILAEHLGLRTAAS